MLRAMMPKLLLPRLTLPLQASVLQQQLAIAQHWATYQVPALYPLL